MISIAKRLRPCGLLAIALLAGRIAAFSSTSAHFFDRCPSPESRRIGGGVSVGHRGHTRRRTRRRTTWPLESTRTTPQPHDAATASIDDDGISSQSTIPRGGDAEEDGSDRHDFDAAAATAGSGGTVGSTGSTAIVLNMNARSVTPALISIASDIVGPDNVFVTCSAEDAVLAARTVVRGRIDRPTLVTAAAEGNEGNCGEDIIIIPRRRRYSLVIPVGGDGTLSGWVNTMIDEILLFHKLEHEQQQQREEKNRTASWKTGNNNNNNNNETNITTIIQNDDDDEYAPMSVEEAMDHMPHLGYIPMGTGNGLGYVIGCKEVGEGGPSLLSRANIFGRKRRKAILAGKAMAKLKGVGDAIQEAREEMHQLDDKLDVSDAISAKCSIVEMPLMEVTHPPEVGTITNDNDNDNAPRAAVTKKGDLCFFAGAGFDSLMLHDFQTIKSWSKSSRRRKTPHFVRDALSSVMGYCVALVAWTLPRTVRYGTHNIHVEVTTEDEGTLWVDHRRGDFSELAIAAAARRRGGEEGDDDNDEKLTTTQRTKKKKKKRHLIYSGSTGIIAASTTPYYGGGLRLFPYARLFPERLQLRLGRISPLTGFLNIPKIFEGSYREKSARDFGCLDFVGTEFEVEVSSGRYDEYVRKRMSKKKKKGERSGGRSKRWLWLRRRRSKGDDSDELSPSKAVSRGFPFQHSGESMGTKERFKVRVVREPVKFVSFLEPRVIIDD